MSMNRVLGPKKSSSAIMCGLSEFFHASFCPCER
jgi:hypothetical protein